MNGAMIMKRIMDLVHGDLFICDNANYLKWNGFFYRRTTLTGVTAQTAVAVISQDEVACNPKDWRPD